jgi:hypothetical protein
MRLPMGNDEHRVTIRCNEIDTPVHLESHHFSQAIGLPLSVILLLYLVASAASRVQPDSSSGKHAKTRALRLKNIQVRVYSSSHRVGCRKLFP